MECTIVNISSMFIKVFTIIMYNSGNTITHWVLIERKCFMYIEYTQNSTTKQSLKYRFEYGVALFPFPSY